MAFSFLMIGIALFVYFILWQVYLFIAPKFISEDAPNFVREPKFWQFFLLIFALGVIRKKLDI